MSKQTLFVAFSTQKGGVGKTTFTVLVASYMYYVKGYNVAVVDCDYPQFSINAMRKRDAEQIADNEFYSMMAYNQFKSLGKKSYPIICSTPEDAIESTNDFLNESKIHYDIVFFDLPGSVDSAGVLKSLSQIDYIFTPIAADRIVLESSLAFAYNVHEMLVISGEYPLKGLYVFWNKVDGREKTELYEKFEKIVNELGIPLMKTYIPDSKRYNKEISEDRRALFRSTIFPPDSRLIKGSNLNNLIDEICRIIQL